VSDQKGSPERLTGQGVVLSLHVHPPEPGGPLTSLACLNLVAGQGIQEDSRYLARRSQRTGHPSRRQVSLIAREEIAEHAAVLGLESIQPGAVRSNIETSGVEWLRWVGREVEIGEALLLIHAQRDPCAKMDEIAPGLRERMKGGRQGVVATVLRSGSVQVGAVIRVR